MTAATSGVSGAAFGAARRTALAGGTDRGVRRTSSLQPGHLMNAVGGLAQIPGTIGRAAPRSRARSGPIPAIASHRRCLRTADPTCFHPDRSSVARWFAPVPRRKAILLLGRANRDVAGGQSRDSNPQCRSPRRGSSLRFFGNVSPPMIQTELPSQWNQTGDSQGPLSPKCARCANSGHDMNSAKSKISRSPAETVWSMIFITVVE